MKKILLILLLFSSVAYGQNKATLTPTTGAWSLVGNTVTGSTHVLGSTNNASLRFITNNVGVAVLDSNGRLGIGTPAPGELLSLGLAGTLKGVLSLSGNTSGKIIIQPADAAGTYTLTLPTTDGGANEFLQTDGSGVLTWAAAGTGTVTNVATGYGLSGGPITTTGTILVDSATIYAGAISTIALTTTGTSGAATWNSTTRILNIPQYPAQVYPGAGIAVSTGSAWGTSITDNSTNWNTAYTDRLKWDGGATGLTASTGRTSLGGTTIGQNIFTSTNPSAITFGRANADNTFDWLSAADFRTAIGAGTGSGTVTAVSVASANGFAGSSSGGATPALTLSTTITGLLQGDGTAISGITNSSTVGQVLRVTGASTYAWGALDLADADAVTGILGAANGGTGNGFTAFTGPTTSTKTFTLPNASSTILTSNAVVTIAQGGTNNTSLSVTQGSIYYGDGSKLVALAPGTSGQFLKTQGAAANPVWDDAGGATEGTYSGTVTNTANISSASATGHYIRVGNTVTVWGNVTFTFTAANTISFEMSLPVASNLANTYDLTGSLFMDANLDANQSSSWIKGEVTNNTARITGWPNAYGSGTVTIGFSFTYKVI